LTIDSGIRKLYRRDNQPFAQIPNDAIRDPEITSGAFRLLAYLMSHQDGYELTYSQIERQTGMGRYAINEGIKVLETKGWLTTERTQGPDGRFGPKSWTVLNPTSVGNSTAGDSTVEKPTDNKNTTLREDKELRTLAQDKLEPGFIDFWNIYPRRVGKAAAWKAFIKARKDTELETIIDGAARLAQDRNLPPKQFIPHPATWLGRAGWEDEPYPERQRTKEELEAIRAEKVARDREKALNSTLRLRAEQLEAEAKASPPPKCPHGASIVSCRQCLRNVASKS
jgi:hypothetical protein